MIFDSKLIKPLALAIALGSFALASSIPAWAENAEQKAIKIFDIPASDLDKALNYFAVAAGIRFHLDAKDSKGLKSPGLKGSYSPQQGLYNLLRGTNLNSERQTDGSYKIYRNDLGGIIEMSPVRVKGSLISGGERDETGYNAVFDENISSVYMGKKEIERYSGANAIDLFKGMANVQGGDGRNGGAIDPNIRGVQGAGRVPVIIDGTEQAISVYQGYRGAANRSYIDSNLISSVKVHTGPSISPGVHTSVGGAVEMTTLSAADILGDSENDSGFDIKIDTGSNTTTPNSPRIHAGKHWTDVPEYLAIARYGGVDNLGNTIWREPITLYGDPAIHFQTEPKNEQTNNPFNGEDIAVRIAGAKRWEKFDIMGAYAYRKTGNYFSGKNGADPYRVSDDQIPLSGRQPTVTPEKLALSHYPGHEVFNTSTEMDSWLLKGTLSFNDFNKLELSARLTDATYGEVFASRSGNRNTDLGMSQWPVNNIKSQAFSARYRWNPDNPLIDLKTNLWTTLTQSGTNTSGQVNYIINNPSVVDGHFVDHPDTGYIINTAAAKSEDIRIGFDFSNQFKLQDNLNLILAGRTDYHQLKPSKGLPTTEVIPVLDTFGALRAGTRREYEGSFKIDWKPIDRLTLAAGLRYASYKLKDDYVANRIKYNDADSITVSRSSGSNIGYQTSVQYTAAEIQARVDAAVAKIHQENQPSELQAEISGLQAQSTQLHFLIQSGHPAAAQIAFIVASIDARIAEINALLSDFGNTVANLIQQATASIQSETTYTKDNEVEWTRNERGLLSASENPCLNNPEETIEGFIAGSCRNKGNLDYEVDAVAKVNKQGGGWMPEVSATFAFSDYSRAYIRYTEHLRFPSMFGGTFGFSTAYTTISPFAGVDLKPERAKNIELAYIHNFSAGSIKFTAFDLSITDLMDRDTQWRNFDEQHLRGLEFQGRFDTGQFFGDLSLAYNLVNEVCDAGSAADLSMYNLNLRNLLHPNDPKPAVLSNCVEGGFPTTVGGSYASTRAGPPLAGSLQLGGRFFNKQLETGVRVSFTKDNNKDAQITRPGYTTVDAFVNYNINKKVRLELVGSNLGDIYYQDAVTTSSMPAPGRTIKLSLTGNF